MGGASSCTGRPPPIVPKPYIEGYSDEGKASNASSGPVPFEHTGSGHSQENGSSAVMAFNDRAPHNNLRVQGGDSDGNPNQAHASSPTRKDQQQQNRNARSGDQGRPAGGARLSSSGGGAKKGVLYTSKWGNGSTPGGVPGGDEGQGLLTDHLARHPGVDAGVQTDPLHLMPSQSYTHPTAPGLAGLGLGPGGQGAQNMLWDSAMLLGSPHGGSLPAILPLERGPSMPSTWRKGESLGSGAFGTVFLGLNNDTGELLAVKEVTVIEGEKGAEAVQQLEQEVALLSGLNHPNIVRYVGTRREQHALLIFLEYVPGGSIASLLARFGPLPEPVIRLYTRQLLSGLAYLHAQRTMHRDVKGANLLVDKSGRIKLADFGMAKTMAEAVSYTKSFKGSAFWMAPEVIRQQGHGVAADIWSLGCTVLEMATGKPPWAQCTTQVQAIFKIASSSELPAIPAALSPQASEFILLCLQRDPSDRPSAEALLKHPFVAIRQDTPVSPAVAEQLLFQSLPQHTGWDNMGHVGATAGRQQQPQMAQTQGRVPAKDPAATSPKHAPQGAAQAAPPGTSTGHTAGAAGGHGGGVRGAAPSGLVGQSAAGSEGATDEELQDALAALVLGSGLQGMAATKAHRGGAAAGGGAGAGGAAGGSGALHHEGGAGGRGGAGVDEDPAAVAQRETDEGMDFTTQPSQFKVRGLLTLPPLRQLAGGVLPSVQYAQLYAQRPGTTSSTVSMMQSRFP